MVPLHPLTIHRDDKKAISPHFNTHEFYSNSSDAPESHPLYPQLVNAAELLRNRFGAWRITSNFRTEAHERQILAKLGTPFFVDEHMKGRAIDSQPGTADPARNAQIMKELAADFLANGNIYRALRLLGITGFGLYDTFVHLDCRDSNFKAQRRDQFGLVACWDSRRSAEKRFGGAAFAQKKNLTRNPTRNPTSPLTSPVSAFPTARRPEPAHSSR